MFPVGMFQDNSTRNSLHALTVGRVNQCFSEGCGENGARRYNTRDRYGRRYYCDI